MAARATITTATASARQAVAQGIASIIASRFGARRIEPIARGSLVRGATEQAYRQVQPGTCVNEGGSGSSDSDFVDFDFDWRVQHRASSRFKATGQSARGSQGQTKAGTRLHRRERGSLECGAPAGQERRRRARTPRRGRTCVKDRCEKQAHEKYKG